MGYFGQRKRFRSYLLKFTRKHENNIKKSQIVLISGEKCVIIYVSIKLIYTSKNL